MYTIPRDNKQLKNKNNSCSKVNLSAFKDMEEKFRLAVGIMGNAASMLLYSAPMLTFARVIRKKTCEEYSCVPYIMALMNCFLYTWYGLPVVSYKWENFPVVTINGLGILLELCFILIYFYFASTSGKKKVAMMTIPVVLVSCTVALLSAFVFDDHGRRKAFVGSIGLVASVAMYASPLVVMKQVIESKSVEFMPFYLSFFSFLASSLWMAYGLLSHDLFLASPNLVGSPLGILQLLLYCKYRNTKMGNTQEEENAEKGGIEYVKDDEKTNQLVVTVATNEK